MSIPALIAYFLARRPVRSDAVARAIRSQGLLRHIPKADIFKGKGVVTKRLADIANYLQYGTSHLGAGEGAVPSKAKRIKEVLFSPMSKARLFHKAPITLGSGNAPVRGLEDKAIEAALFAKHAPGAMAETIRVSQLPKAVLGIRNQAKRLDAIQAALKNRFPKGYIIKGVNEAQTAGQLLTEKDNLRRILLLNRATGPNTPIKLERGVLDILMRKPETITKNELMRLPVDQRAQILRSVPHFTPMKHIRGILKRPNRLIVQERLPIEKTNIVDQLLGSVIGKEILPAQEFRVHTIGSRVMPGATTHRFGPATNILMALGYKPRMMREAERFAAKQMKKLPKPYAENRFFALDVAKTPKGYKIIETNPEGYSGFLHPIRFKADPFSAIASHRLVSHLQGRKTVPLALANAVAAGGLGYGGLATSRAVTNASGEKKRGTLPLG